MQKITTLKNSLAIRILLVVIAFLIMILSSSIVMYYTLNDKLLQSAESMMDDTQILFSRIMNEPETVLELIAANIEGMYNRGAGFEAIKAYIDEASSPDFKDRVKTEYYTVYAYFDIAGVFHDGLGWIPDESYIPYERPWYTAAPETGEIGISEPYIDANTSRRVVSYARRMFDDSGNNIGVAAIDVFIEDLRDMVINKQITPNSYGYMIDETYRVIMHQNISREGEYFWESNSATGPYKDLITEGKDISFQRATNYEGTRVFVFGRQIDNGWYFTLIVPETEYYAELYSLIATTGILGAALALLLILILISLEKAWRKADDERINKTIQLTELEKAREADRRIQLMLDSAPLCVIFWDSELNVVDCNLEGVKLFDLADKKELMERWYDLSPEYQPDGRISRDAIDELVNETLEKKYIRFEWMHRKLNGEEIPCEVTLISTTFMETPGLLGYVRDLRELKSVLGELEEALNEAKIANQSKSTFLAQMSHEIRTPMNSIMGVTEILLEDELPEDMSNGLGIIYNSCDLLLGIINDILDFSKIEAGKMDINPGTYHIASLINDSANLNMMRIGSKEISFELNVDENLPAKMIGDELRIKQILNNILSNAFKYTNSGTVTLSARHEMHGGRVMLILSVRDTGCGMTEQQVEKLFDEYERFNQGKYRNVEGTGLGLAITLRLVNLMGGEISVESKPGEGSVFEVRLPQATDGDETVGREVSENLRSFKLKHMDGGRRARILREPMPYGHVLIVDDVDTNLFVAKGLMRPYELQIDTAMSGPEAIDKIKDGNVYDVIFMDHMMPEMDGIEAVKHIRDTGYGGPIVALTANAVTGQSDVFLENGFDSFIAKPIDLRQLNSALNKYIRDKQPKDVIDAARARASEKAENGEKTEENTQEPKLISRLQGKEITGIDIHGGVERFGGDEETYLKILRSYMAGTRNILGSIKDFDAGNAKPYEIAVHSIKGTSYDILAMDTGDRAKSLENAVKSGDFDYINEHNAAFISDTLQMLDELDTFISSIETENPKPKKDKPDERQLLGLLKACKEYDMDAVDAAMAAIDEFDYENDGGLVAWLRENVNLANFTQIAERLESK